MNSEIFIPISLFACIAFCIKFIVDGYTRRRIIESRGSEELVRTMLEGESLRRRHASLHWGCVLVLLAAGFGLLESMNTDHLTAGAAAILLGATGLGNLVFYALERRAK